MNGRKTIIRRHKGHGTGKEGKNVKNTQVGQEISLE